MSTLVRCYISVLIIPLEVAIPNSTTAARSEFEIRVVDEETEQPIAVRMHLKDSRGRRRRIAGGVNWGDHFTFFHKLVLKLPPGHYSFEMERGCEYYRRTGNFTIEPGAEDHTVVRMKRFVDMKNEGWWSGDLGVARQPRHIKLVMLAEDLHVVPTITWDNHRELEEDGETLSSEAVRFDDDRFFQLLAGQDRRRSGTVTYFNLEAPLKLTGVFDEYPSPVEFLKLSRKHPHAHATIENPLSWDTPVWLASRMIGSVGLLPSTLGMRGNLRSLESGKTYDRKVYPPPHGMGQAVQDIYYHILNSGLKLPCVASSGSGIVSNPAGYNRVYVHLDGEITYDKWWEGLHAGRVVVTNGPLLRPSVKGHAPGHTFQADVGETVRLPIDLRLATRDSVDYLEIVQNGTVTHTIHLDEWAAKHGRLPELEFQQSGWFLVRAISNHPESYRFASTGPYYVEIGGTPRISKNSARFFLDWLHERVHKIERKDPKQYREVIRYHRAARQFWRQQLDRANVE